MDNEKDKEESASAQKLSGTLRPHPVWGLCSRQLVPKAGTIAEDLVLAVRDGHDALLAVVGEVFRALSLATGPGGG